MVILSAMVRLRLDLRRELVEQIRVRARVDLAPEELGGRADRDPGHLAAQALACARGVELDLLLRGARPGARLRWSRCPWPASTSSLARCCAWSMIWVARSRASRTMSSALPRASVSACSPFSAAASPCAILRERSSMAARMCGQTNFIVPKISKPNTSICTMSVRLMFTILVSCRERSRALDFSARPAARSRTDSRT